LTVGVGMKQFTAVQHRYRCVVIWCISCRKEIMVSVCGLRMWIGKDLRMLYFCEMVSIKFSVSKRAVNWQRHNHATFYASRAWRIKS